MKSRNSLLNLASSCAMRGPIRVAEGLRRTWPAVLLGLAMLAAGAVWLATAASARTWAWNSLERLLGHATLHGGKPHVFAQLGGSGAYTITTIDEPSAGTGATEGTIIFGVNASGGMTGAYADRAGVAHGFVDVNGTFTSFDALNETGLSPKFGWFQGTTGISIDSAGDVAGAYVDGNNASHGFVRSAAGTITTFDDPNAPTANSSRGTFPLNMNDSGQIVGFYTTGNYNTTSLYRGFLYSVSSKTFTAIDEPNAGTGNINSYQKQGTVPMAINASGTVTGYYMDSNGARHAFIYSAGNYTSFDVSGAVTNTQKGGGLSGTVAMSIDTAGDVVGSYTDSSFVRHGYIRSASGTITTFDAPGASSSGGTLPMSIDPSGSFIAGGYTDSSGLEHGFVEYLPLTSSRSFTTFTPPGMTTSTVLPLQGAVISVNASGTVVGFYLDNNEAGHGFKYTSTPTATPTFNPPQGTYSSTQSVTISDSDSSAAIYYTTDGSTPSVNATKYTGAISVSVTQTIRAIALDTTVGGYIDSAVASATYTISGTTGPAATPAFSPGTGSYSSAQMVTISDTTPNAMIYYTTNNTTPTTSSTVYSGPINVTSTETIQAMATASGYTQSAVATATYTINGTNMTATPVLSPDGGVFGSPFGVTITDATPGATIYYTTDGSTPTTSSILYTEPITVAGISTETIRAIAVSSGMADSNMASAVFTLTPVQQVGFPTPSLGSGTYTSAQTVTFSETTPGATIYYTTDGTIPTASSAVYSSAITVSSTETLQAIAMASGYAQSPLISETYIIAAANDTIENLVFVGTATCMPGFAYQECTGGTVGPAFGSYTLDVTTQKIVGPWSFVSPFASFTSGDPGARAVVSNDAMNGGISYDVVAFSEQTTGFNEDFNFGFEGVNALAELGIIANPPPFQVVISGICQNAPGSSPHGCEPDVNIAGATSLATQQAATPVFSVPAGTYTSAQTVNISDATTGAAIYYTTSPTVAFTLYSGPITVSTTETVEAIAVASGYTQSSMATANYAIGPPAATPTFSPVAGTYSSAQSVTINDATSGATIYYTTNNTTPTTSSTIYSGAINVSSSETIQAIATASGYTQSAVGTAAYTINLPSAATPTFNPPGGTYSSAQTVIISDTTPGATIYYTTNGTTPTTSSTVYTSPIVVSSSETIKAIATAPGYSQSSVPSAAYTISPGNTSTYTTLVNFNGGNGALPTSGALIQGTDGNFYGTTTAGGSTNNGTIFKVTPSGNLTTIYSVCSQPLCTDGWGASTLVLGANGTMYGSTATGGPNTCTDRFGTGGCGTIFQIDPSGVLTTLHDFAGSDGDAPNGPPIVGTDGNLYETTLYGGANNLGTIFQITPGGHLTSLYSFCNGSGCTGGVVPMPLIQGTDGNFYGTTFNTIYKVTPQGVETTLHTFSGNDGNAVYAPLVQASNGNFYGVASAGGNGTTASCDQSGNSGFGTIFQITPSGVFTTLYSFQGSNDGATPNTTLMQATDGSLYGTTACGGANGAGTIFSIAPAGVFTPLYSFAAPAGKGAVVQGGLVQGADGSFYGTTPANGTNNDGTVFKLSVGIAPFAKTIPTSGAAGTQVQILGTNLTGTTAVSFNGTAATFTVVSGSDIRATVPAGATTGTVTVTTPVGTLSSNQSFQVTNQAATPVISPAGGMYSSAQTVSITDATSGATIRYTTDGTTPTANSAQYSGPISVSSNETLEAVAIANGLTASPVASAVYFLQTPTPVFSPGSGTYSSTQTVTISDTIPEATIHYTTNGTTPTTSSTVYSVPNAITVNAGETLEAIAVAPGISTSAVATATYNFLTPAPAFSPAAGTYTSAQAVTISDAATGATIYYTTNGTMPTTSSSVYSSPIAVSATETIEAIAVAPSTGTSTAASASYVIAPPFAIAPATGSPSSVTVSAGGTANYTLTLTPSGVSTFPAAISFSASGLPSGATATFTPSSVAAGSGTTQVALSIKTSSTSARVESGKHPWLIALGVLIVPLVGMRRARKLGWAAFGMGMLVLCLLGGAITACGGGGGGGGGGNSPQTYLVTIIATSGQVQQATSVTLNVQ